MAETEVPESTPELEPGTLLGQRYTVLRKIADGGMSTIYEVEDERLPGRLIAKEMKGLPNTELADLFRREAEVLSKLSHPNLPKVTDYFEWQGRRFLVEEFVEGETIEEVAGRGLPLQEQKVVGWATQICEALQYLHDHGLIYRDLKPSNVMLTPTSEIRLIDFGLVRFFAEGKKQDTVIMGTPGFAAPEQYGTRQTDPRSDVFSLAALMHYLLTGIDPVQRPFVFDPPRQLNPALSEHVDFSLRKALSMDASLRFESAEEFQAGIQGHRPLSADGERFSFALEAEKVQPTVTATLATLSLSAVGWFCLNTVPLSACFALGFTPLWLATLWRRYLEQRHLASLLIRLEPEGLVVVEGGHSRRWHWNQIREVRYEHRRFDLTPLLCIRLKGRELRLPVGPPEVLESLSNVPGLQNADRLARVVIDRAGLQLTRPGGRSYR